jgi:hypothetical protein
MMNNLFSVRICYIDKNGHVIKLTRNRNYWFVLEEKKPGVLRHNINSKSYFRNCNKRMKYILFQSVLISIKTSFVSFSMTGALLRRPLLLDMLIWKRTQNILFFNYLKKYDLYTRVLDTCILLSISTSARNIIAAYKYLT